MVKKIVISEFMDGLAVRDLSADYNVVYGTDLVDQPDRLFFELADADALIVRNRTQVCCDLLSAAPKLKAVGRLGVGLDNIDLEACKARKISVLPATGANDLSVAEYVLTTAFILLRGTYLEQSQMIAGEWPRQAMCGREASGKILGLVGFGSIARETAKRAGALGMLVAATDPFVQASDPIWSGVERHANLDSLLGVADVLSLHVPLTDQTHNMIDNTAMSKMKAGGIIINAARGGVVNEEALVAQMKSGHISGAALDVFAAEPLKTEDGARFSGVSNLILTPHIAGVTTESNARVSALTARNIRNAL